MWFIYCAIADFSLKLYALQLLYLINIILLNSNVHDIHYLATNLIHLKKIKCFPRSVFFTAIFIKVGTFATWNFFVIFLLLTTNIPLPIKKWRRVPSKKKSKAHTRQIYLL